MERAQGRAEPAAVAQPSRAADPGVLVRGVAGTCWSAVYNTAFDRLECWWSGRVASDRTPSLRVVHAVGLEATAVVLTWPLIVALSPLGWLAALKADLGLTIAYVAYGYAFHLGFDRLRPVQANACRLRRGA